MRRYCLPAAFAASFAAPVLADVPAVVTDIAPVHSLVAQVMAGVGEPTLIVPPRASPHGYAMRPSEARALSGADLVVWVGPALTPWLSDPIETLAGQASHLALMAQPGTRLLPFREGAAFEAHDHGSEGHETDANGHNHDGHDHDHDNHDHDDHDHDAHDHAGHAEEGHDQAGDHDHSEHEETGHEGEDHADDHAGHNHSGTDPHVWLDPVNGQLWLGQIAAALSAQDPENAAQYHENATAAQAKLAALEADILAQLAPLRGRPFIVFHDAYHYFEARFDVEATGAISENDARTPGAARVAELRAVVTDSGAKCVFTEPQFNPGLIAAVAEGQAVKTGVLDPIGAGLEPGPALYGDLLRGMAESMAACLPD